MVNGEYKNIMKRIMMIIMAVALIALPTMAQQQEGQSTSAMQGSGSTYSSQVNAIGAESANQMATTTTASYAPAKAPNGPHRSIEYNGEWDGDEGSPIGDAMVPLSLIALAFCGVVYFRRKRALNS